MAQRILVVEDDPLLAESLVRALQQQGYRIGHARRGHDAETLLRAQHFDLLLLDIGLPDIDGFELLRRLRARGDAAVVLVVTARDAVDERVHGLDLGASGHGNVVDCHDAAGVCFAGAILRAVSVGLTYDF